MIASIEFGEKSYRFDLRKAIDISMPLAAEKDRASAWYVDPVRIEAVRTDQFIGSVKEGGSVNFRDIAFNPHGNGTHTECVGHISKEDYSVNKCITDFFFTAEVVSISPEIRGEDLVLTKKQFEESFREEREAIVIRTLPNDASKMHRQYSDTNPPYIEAEAIPYLLQMGVKHLLIDLPSVDREVDGGVLAAHHAFWNYPNKPALDRSITEFIYVDPEIQDGFYLLNLNFAPFENDASPSKPLLFRPL